MNTPDQPINYHEAIEPLINDLLEALHIEGALDEEDNLIPGSSLKLSASFDLTMTTSYQLVGETTRVVYEVEIDPVEVIDPSAWS